MACKSAGSGSTWQCKVGGGGGGFRTKPRIEIEFVWTHAHCSYVKTALKPCDVRANGDETWTWSHPAPPRGTDRDRSRNRWSLCVLTKMEALPCWNFGDLFVERNCSLIISRVQHDRLLVNRARHWRLDWELLSFPGLWCISLPSEAERHWVKKSLAFGTLWMFLFSIQSSGAGRSNLFFSAAVNWEGKSSLWPPWERSTVHD